MGSGEVFAIVREALANARYLCRTEDGSELTCHVSGEAVKAYLVQHGEAVQRPVGSE